MSGELGADLHIHSHFSDGQDSPAELLRRAERRLALISICDHDTIAAYDDLSPGPELRVLPGIEISTVTEGHGIHLLGYFPEGFPAPFREHVRQWENDRRERVMSGVRRLRDRGIALRWSLLEECLGEGVPCRSHVARALVRMGVGRTPHGLYSRYLTDFDPPRVSTRDAIGIVRDAGGVSVWAHPDLDHVQGLGERLAESGLRGVEVWTRWGKGPRLQILEEFRERHGLLGTGGSDYHSPSRSFSLGRFRVPMERLPEVLRG